MSRKFDRAAVMRDAHKRFRDGQRLNLGWTWSQCLSTAWRAAKIRRDMEQRTPVPAIETRRASPLARTTPAIAEQAQRAPSTARRPHGATAHTLRMDGPTPTA